MHPSYDSKLIETKHSCAIATLSDLDPGASSVLDLGGGGISVCRALQVCLNDLTNDILRWVKKVR